MGFGILEHQDDSHLPVRIALTELSDRMTRSSAVEYMRPGRSSLLFERKHMSISVKCGRIFRGDAFHNPPNQISSKKCERFFNTIP